MLSTDLFATARYLATRNRTRPKQSDLRRAVSTAYYALFHTLSEVCADSLVGSASPDRTERAWVHAYRSINHRAVADACARIIGDQRLDFPQGAQDFAASFPTLMKLRHSADYDPTMRLAQSEALVALQDAKAAADAIRTLEVRQRKALAVYFLFPKPRS